MIMRRIDVRKRAPNVFTNERDVKLPDAMDASAVKNALKKTGEYPDFGGHLLQPGEKHWYDDIPDGPFNPYADMCGIRHYNDGYSNDFLICGEAEDDGIFTIRYCDFNESYNESFSVCKRPSACRVYRR